jgi:OmpA-OmpF porin, OOP family
MKIRALHLTAIALAATVSLGGCAWLQKFPLFQSKPKYELQEPETQAAQEPRMATQKVASAEQNSHGIGMGPGATLKSGEGKAVATGYGDCVRLGHAIAGGEATDDCGSAVTTPIAEERRLTPTEPSTAVKEPPLPQPPTAQPATPPAAQAPAPRAPVVSELESGTPVPGTVPAPKLEKITLLGDVLFAFGKSNLQGLSPSGKQKLDELAAHIKTYDPATLDKISVVGHADRLGKRTANLRISQRRAETIKSYLAQAGVAPEKISSAGKGSLQPIAQCKGNKKNAKLVACLAPNRRVDVHIHGRTQS